MMHLTPRSLPYYNVVVYLWYDVCKKMSINLSNRIYHYEYGVTQKHNGTLNQSNNFCRTTALIMVCQHNENYVCLWHKSVYCVRTLDIRVWCSVTINAYSTVDSDRIGSPFYIPNSFNHSKHLKIDRLHNSVIPFSIYMTTMTVLVPERTSIY